MQVRLCRAKGTGEIFAMKKLKKSEMLSRGQVNLDGYVLMTVLCPRNAFALTPNSSLMVLSSCPQEELDIL